MEIPADTLRGEQTDDSSLLEARDREFVYRALRRHRDLGPTGGGGVESRFLFSWLLNSFDCCFGSSQEVISDDRILRMSLEMPAPNAGLLPKTPHTFF